MSEHALTHSLLSFPQEDQTKVKYLSLAGRGGALSPLVSALRRQRQDFWVWSQPGQQSEFKGYTEKPRSRVTCSSSHPCHAMQGSHLSPFAITGRHNCLFPPGGLLVMFNLFSHTGCFPLSAPGQKKGSNNTFNADLPCPVLTNGQP